ncbi:transposase [Alkalibacillus haloalkaliphilus]
MSLVPFHSVGRMFQRWAKEIVHSFMYPYSNAEGINNTIKVLKRISYGI